MKKEQFPKCPSLVFEALICYNKSSSFQKIKRKEIHYVRRIRTLIILA